MAVKVVITLEGVEEVKRGLNEVTQAGTKSAQAINSLNTTEINAALQNLGVVSGGAATGMGRLTVEAKNLKQAKLLLKPILEQVGVSVGGIAAFAGAARLGLIGLAAAAGGAVAVSLAKLSDNLEKSKRQLDAFGSGKPGEVFDLVNASAKRLGTTVTGLAPVVQSAVLAMEKLQGASSARFVAPEGQTLPESLLTNLTTGRKAADALISVLVRNGSSFGEAQAAAKNFFDQLGAGQQITAEMIQALRLVNEGAVKELSRIFTGSEQDIGRWVTALAPAPIIADQTKIAIRNLAAEAAKPIPTTGIRSMQDGLDQLQASLDRLAQKSGGKSFSQIIGSGLATLGTSLEALFGGRSLSDILTQDAKDAVGAFQFIIDAGKSAFAQLVQIFGENPFNTSSWLSTFTSFFNQVIAAARSAFQQIQSAFNQLDLSGASGLGISPGGEGVPFAGGGHVRGPGSSTSDSIFARLSDFEYVIRASAVRHYGVPLMNAINQMLLPKDFFRGFAGGGLAVSRMPVPAFAGGGLATGGMNELTLVIGNERFGGLMAPDDVADKIIRFGRKRNFASAGKAPSRVGLR